MGTLFIVATPIGNMEDLSPRARRVLSEVSLIAAEDTRHTGVMLKRLGVTTPMLSNHGFNERARVSRFLQALSDGDVALVSDSGTPAISDPGAILVGAAATAGFPVVPIPGPSALTAAVSASGLINGPFMFLGFLPRSGGERASLLDTALGCGMPLVLYESAPRIVRLCQAIAEGAPDRELVVFRELTKIHEEAIRGRAAVVQSLLMEATLKGEFVVVVGAGTSDPVMDLEQLILERLGKGDRPSDIARELARESGTNRSDVYSKVLELGARED